MNGWKIKEVHVRWLGIPLVALLAYIFIPHPGDTTALQNYLLSVLFTTVYWNGAAFIFFFFRRQFLEIRQTVRRLIFTFLGLTFWMAFGGVPVKLLLGQDLVGWNEHLYFLPFNMIIGAIIGTLYETTHFFHQWKHSIRQNEELKNQQIRTQFEVLQNQMSPHFLFNSLNTLTTLIAENQEKAIRFTEKLSEVYRYILHHKSRELVRLDEELAFARAYFYLLQMRYPDNVSLEVDVDAKYLKEHIAPLTLQMLIENAVKHNVVSKAHPLSIQIYVDNGESIVVKNNLQRKPVLPQSTKTGLENIQKRYTYLGDRHIDVITTASNFMVAIPLIHLVPEQQALEEEEKLEKKIG